MVQSKHYFLVLFSAFFIPMALSSARDLTIEEFRNLSIVAGPEVAVEVFRKTVESKPENQYAFRQTRSIFESLIKSDKDKGEEELARRSAGVLALIGSGMAIDPEHPEKIRGIIRSVFDELPRLGVETVYLRTDPYGTLQENSKRFENQLREHVKTGKKIILLALSKGVPELLYALGSVSDSLDPGQFLGFISLSGMVRGTFYGDTVEKIPELGEAGGYLSDQLTGFFHGLGGAFRQADGMSQKKMEIFNKLWYSRVPRKAVYLSVGGLSVGPRPDDLPEDEIVEMSRKFNGTFHVTRAGNDGYVEQPHLELLPGLSARQYTLLVDSSHILTDGHWRGTILRKVENQRALLQALHLFIISEAEKFRN